MNTKKTFVQRLLAACLVGMGSGFILFTLPEMVRQQHAVSLVSLIDPSVKNMSALHLLLLLVGGVFWGSALKWPYSFAAAVCQVASLPVFAVIEMLKDSTSHNLWPFEFLIYAALALVSLMGAVVAWLVKRMFTAKTQLPG